MAMASLGHGKVKYVKNTRDTPLWVTVIVEITCRRRHLWHAWRWNDSLFTNRVVSVGKHSARDFWQKLKIVKPLNKQ